MEDVKAYIGNVTIIFGKILVVVGADKTPALAWPIAEILVEILGYNNYNNNRNILVIFNYIINLDFNYFMLNLIPHFWPKSSSIDKLDSELE